MQLKTIEILLVEDNAAEARLMREALQDAGLDHRLNIASSGEDALEFLFQCGAHSEAPCADLVLLDLNLPGKSGHDVLKEVKSRPETRRIPVIVMSSSRAHRDISRAYGAHANCYVTKPANLDEFFNVVRSIENFWFQTATLPNLHS